MDERVFGDLFCGAGGFTLGFVQAGFLSSWGIDCDPDACETFRRNIGSRAVCAKAEHVRFEDVEPVRGLLFGFPCNDFSVVGKRKGLSGYFGGLYREAVRALHALRPLWYVAENVPGLLSAGGEGVIREFADAGPGYVVSVHLFRFEEYGVPQSRHRVVAVGLAAETGLRFLPPAPSVRRPVSCSEAISRIPPDAPNNEMPVHDERVVELLRSIPPGANCWHPSVPPHLRPNVIGARLSNTYRRLDPDKPSPTILANGGGGTHGYHWEEPRALTNRERAALQTFPHDFVFHGGRTSVRRQIGMAVPPLAARQIAEALRKTLDGEGYSCVSPSCGFFSPSFGLFW